MFPDSKLDSHHFFSNSPCAACALCTGKERKNFDPDKDDDNN